MINKTIKKIHHYRLGFLFLISFLFLTYVGLNPLDISKYYGARLGSAVGMSVSIPENPISKIALELKEKEEDLNTREVELKQLEDSLKKEPIGDRFIIWLMASGILALFILIVVNFYLDKRHRSKNKTL